MKAVLTAKVDPAYDDLPSQHYHFPRSYLNQIQAANGDFDVFYEPRRSGGRQAYFATGRIRGIRSDPRLVDHFYADIDSYLDFERPVPFREGQFYYESAVQRDDGETNKGAFGRSVRGLPENEYDQILKAGFAATISADRPDVSSSPSGFSEETAIFERPIVERLVARPFREAAFSGFIKAAYDDTCAFTGIKIVNGGGRSEVQAAHIRPVAASGPDSLRNGLALCGTVHWMFDRGLISIADDRALLLAKGKIPDPVLRMLNPDLRLLAPTRPDQTPHTSFLRWHRENVFKG